MNKDGSEAPHTTIFFKKNEGYHILLLFNFYRYKLLGYILDNPNCGPESESVTI